MITDLKSGRGTASLVGFLPTKEINLSVSILLYKQQYTENDVLFS